MSMIQSNVIPKLPTGYEIEQSLRFNDDSAYLSRTPSVAGNRKTWTFSTWVKRGNLGTNDHMFSGQSGASISGGVIINASGNLGVSLNGNLYNKYTNAVLRDTSSWYHIVAIYDSTQAVAENRIRLYVNGVEQISYFTQNSGLPPQNYDSPFINNTNLQTLGGLPYYGYYRDGYLAETHFIDGQALTPDYFGEFDSTYGHWKPKKYDGTYGTNGFYLPYSNGGNIGEDNSGNGNDFTATNLSATDIVLDSPTNNFAVNNTLVGAVSLSEGNLKLGSASTTNKSTVQASGNNIYAEFEIQTQVSSQQVIGIVNETHIVTSILGTTSGSWGIIVQSNVSNGQPYHNGTTGTSLTNFTTGDIVQVAYNYDSGKVWFGKNGTWLNSGNPELGTGEVYSGITGDISIASWNTAGVMIANFGQDSSFAGNKTPQGYTDSNGIGDFYYQPPEDYLALCTKNLPEPTVVPSENFDVVTWTGDGNTSPRNILMSIAPDLSWIKTRSSAVRNLLYDKNRGTTYALSSNETNAETSYNYGEFDSFNSDGITIHTNSGTNYLNTNGTTYVAWNWKAGGTPVTNTDGTITSQVSANVDAGFSIVTHNGAVGTVGHGLSKTPELRIEKQRGTNGNWAVQTTVIDGSSDLLYLNLADAKTDSGTLPTSNVFTPAFTTSTIISYCFHSVEGYSKVFRYNGNNLVDGPFVYLGFQARFVIVKASSGAGHWIIVDTERDLYNVVDNELYPSLGVVENSADLIDVDIVSNGIKFRGNNIHSNTNYTYIGYAVAENPFKYSNAR